MLAPWKQSYDKHRQHMKNRDITLPTKDHLVKAMVFPVVMYRCESCHVQMWELDHKECWAPKKWCFWAVLLEKTLKSPLESKEIKPVNSKWNQSWIFTGRTDAEAEVLLLWPSDVKSQLIRKDLMLRKIEAGGEGDDRGWDGWTASLTQCTWVWASSRRWWRTGKPGVLQSIGLQNVRHDWATEQQSLRGLGSKVEPGVLGWLMQ